MRPVRAANDFLSAAEPTAYGITGAVRHDQLVKPTQITMDPATPQPPDQHSSPAYAVGTYPERDRTRQSPDQSAANQKSHPSSNDQSHSAGQAGALSVGARTLFTGPRPEYRFEGRRDQRGDRYVEEPTSPTPRPSPQ